MPSAAPRLILLVITLITNRMAKATASYDR
jgi:hypothetical protein